jgi:TRAP-type C4-dicarboxylate transport system permease small subunit
MGLSVLWILAFVNVVVTYVFYETWTFADQLSNYGV